VDCHHRVEQERKVDSLRFTRELERHAKVLRNVQKPSVNFSFSGGVLTTLRMLVSDQMG
jgi:hypothetical protein